MVWRTLAWLQIRIVSVLLRLISDCFRISCVSFTVSPFLAWLSSFIDVMLYTISRPSCFKLMSLWTFCSLGFSKGHLRYSKTGASIRLHGWTVFTRSTSQNARQASIRKLDVLYFHWLHVVFSRDFTFGRYNVTSAYRRTCTARWPANWQNWDCLRWNQTRLCDPRIN